MFCHKFRKQFTLISEINGFVEAFLVNWLFEKNTLGRLLFFFTNFRKYIVLDCYKATALVTKFYNFLTSDFSFNCNCK